MPKFFFEAFLSEELDEGDGRGTTIYDAGGSSNDQKVKFFTVFKNLGELTYPEYQTQKWATISGQYNPFLVENSRVWLDKPDSLLLGIKAFKRMLHAMTGGLTPNGVDGKPVNKIDLKWQKWFPNDENKSMRYQLMYNFCNWKTGFAPKGMRRGLKYWLTKPNDIFKVQKGWDNILETICACLDKDEDTRLKNKFSHELRVECNGKKCIAPASDAKVFTFNPERDCKSVEIVTCNIDVDLVAEKISLTDVNLVNKCKNNWNPKHKQSGGRPTEPKRDTTVERAQYPTNSTTFNTSTTSTKLHYLHHLHHLQNPILL